MRLQLLYPLMVIVVILGAVGLFSLRYAPDGETPNDIIFVDIDGTSQRISVSDIATNCGLAEKSIYDVWLTATKKYSTLRVYDFIDYMSDISDISDEEDIYSINVVFTNIQGKTVSIPLSNIIEYKDSFLLAVMYGNEELDINFSNNAESGGPSRLLIDDTNIDFISENYGPEYWEWCIYKISLVRGPVT